LKDINKKHSKTVGILTLGCKVNQYETTAMEELFRKSGYTVVDADDKADVYIINSCTVTHMSDKKSRQFLRRARRISPDAVIAVTGCYSQVAPDEVINIPEVDVIVGTKDKSRIVEILENAMPGEKLCRVEDIMQPMEFEEMHIEGASGKTRAYVKVQDGCNRFCSYCIIPYARGSIRSRSIDNIVDEVSRLAELGFKEIVLTGINVACYGQDVGAGGFLDAIKAVHSVDGIERIRMSSVEPDMLTDGFIQELSGLEKVCPHFHLSIQSGCNNTLSRMNRTYTTEKLKHIIGKLRESFGNVALTTDIIVGFPGETDEEFETTYEFLKEVKLFQMHIFKYSPRKGTPAATMAGQVDPHKKQERSERLISLSSANQNEFMEKMIGRAENVLFEQKTGENTYEGHTSNYVKVRTISDSDIEGSMQKVALNEVKGEYIHGIIIQENDIQ